MQLTGVMGVFPCSYRLFDVDDLIWNTSGAVIGYGCAMLFDRLFRRGARICRRSPGRVRASFRGIPHRHGTGRGVRDPCGRRRDGAGHDGFGPSWRDVQRMRLLGPLGFGDIAMLVMLVLFEWVIRGSDKAALSAAATRI